MSEPTTFDQFMELEAIRAEPLAADPEDIVAQMRDMAHRAYAAGVASQQAEIERTRVAMWESERQKIEYLAKLSAVVEKQREALRKITYILGNPAMPGYSVAAAALEEKPAE